MFFATTKNYHFWARIFMLFPRMRLFPNNQWLQRNVNLNCSYNQYFANFEPLCKKKKSFLICFHT